MLTGLLMGQLSAGMTDKDWATQVIREAMERAGYQDMPEVRVVGPDHFLFNTPQKGAHVAVAARDPEGGEWIMLNSAHLPKRQTGSVQHEVGHIAAWRRHGEKIKPHGRQFKKACRQVVTERANAFCKNGFQ